MNVKGLVPESVKHPVKLLLDSEYREISRLSQLPRYTAASTTLFGEVFCLTDAGSFVYGYNEIFKRHIYHFTANHPAPYIIDCGANVGLSIVYFKQMYPDCRIIAFEPDPAIFEVLQKNVKNFHLRDIELVQKAVWKWNGEIDFYAEGGFSGSISEQSQNKTIKKVKTQRLHSLLEQKIDLLKIDIEGAETEVLRDCADKLDGVDRLFVEYHSFAGEEQSLDEILAILKKAGFRYHIKEAYTVEKPFSHLFTGGPDLQLDIFAFRNKKQAISNERE